MRLNIRALFLPAIFLASDVLATQSAAHSNAVPDVTYPADDAFIFCSDPDCAGTCEVVDAAYVPEGDGEAAPNDMGFQSIYWYDPGNYGWSLYTCIDYENCEDVSIGPNACYNLRDSGVATDFYWYWYFINGRG